MMTVRNTLAIVASLLLLAPACSKKRDADGESSGKAASGEATGGNEPAAQTIKIDGSSTVFPITQAVGEEFGKKTGNKITVGTSGTGGGFKKFCRGEIAISDASRPIKESERENCKKAGIDFIELPVAYDGIAVMVHPDNDWVDKMTVAELQKMWSPESKEIKKWSQIRAGWPDEEFVLFGPGTDSGTFDYFTQAINGEEQASRGDFTPSEDDNVLVQGITGNKNSLGYFGFAYYEENADKLKLVAIDDEDPTNGEGAIEPSIESVKDGTYQPLARPIFIYVSSKHVDRPEVKDFIEFFMTEGPALVKEVGYIPLPAKGYELALKRFETRKTGSMFEDGSKVGVTVEELLSKE